jgi:hypothetical protein
MRVPARKAKGRAKKSGDACFHRADRKPSMAAKKFTAFLLDQRAVPFPKL